MTVDMVKERIDSMLLSQFVVAGGILRIFIYYGDSCRQTRIKRDSPRRRFEQFECCASFHFLFVITSYNL